MKSDAKEIEEQEESERWSKRIRAREIDEMTDKYGRQRKIPNDTRA